VINETVRNAQATMDEEYVRTHKTIEMVDKKSWMSESRREELKQIYRKLAHLFHPDLQAGTLSS